MFMKSILFLAAAVASTSASNYTYISTTNGTSCSGNPISYSFTVTSCNVTETCMSSNGTYTNSGCAALPSTYDTISDLNANITGNYFSGMAYSGSDCSAAPIVGFGLLNNACTSVLAGNTSIYISLDGNTLNVCPDATCTGCTPSDITALTGCKSLTDFNTALNASSAILQSIGGSILSEVQSAAASINPAPTITYVKITAIQPVSPSSAAIFTPMLGVTITALGLAIALLL